MVSLESEISSLVGSSVRVALGRFNGLILILDRRVIDDGVHRLLEFSYVFPIGANIQRGFNPASFESIVSHGVNWLKWRLELDDLPSVPELRPDAQAFTHRIDLGKVYGRLERQRKVGTILTEFGIIANMRIAYHLAYGSLESIRKRLPRQEWEIASRSVVERFVQRGCDREVLDRIAKVVFERG